MGLVRRAARFLLAIGVGSVLAALITHAATSPGMFAPLVILGMAATFMLFGLLPALIVGTAALRVLGRFKVGRLATTLIMVSGGAGVGGGLMTVTFFGFESWGAIAGGSIGLMQGLLLYRHPKVSAQASSA